MMIVDVLGTKYTIENSNKMDDLNLETNDGYCDPSTKKIVIDTFKHTIDAMDDLESHRKKVVRHELIHAFLYESGLHACSFAINEELVDWIALQFPKMQKAFEQCEVI